MQNPKVITAIEGLQNQKETFNKIAVFPAVNISETKEDLQLVLEIPGYKHEDVSVRVLQSRLFVSGSRSENHFDKSRMHLSIERIASFRWVYDLKIPFSKNDLSINLENGFLFITVLKTEKTMSTIAEKPKTEGYIDDQVYFPRANVVETENHLEMSLEIPGYDNEDVAIKIINSSLTIRGKRTLTLFKKEQQYLRIEIPFRNSFLRRFELPTNVNQSQASWNVRLGVLYIYLPKLTTIKKAEVSRETMFA